MNVSNSEATSDARLNDLAVEMEHATGIRPIVGSERLGGHTTMRVGGTADLFVPALDAAQLASLAGFAVRHGIPYVVLGRGSDLVVSDAGIRGLVILNRAEGARIEGTRLIAESGLPLASAATMTQEAGLTGLEFGLAVPGTVGGAVWANAGAHGSDIASVLETATVLLADGTVAVEAAATLDLGYRESRFKHRPGELILGATFALTPDDPAAIKSRLAEIRTWRREHQPLARPSAGSVFRNPPGDSAGRLIDACGLRGSRLGGAEISTRHANFIVNVGEATASDIRRLAERARQAVAGRFGIELEYEVQFVGDWSDWSGG